MSSISKRFTTPLSTAVLVLTFGSFITFLTWRSTFEPRTNTARESATMGSKDFAKQFQERIDRLDTMARGLANKTDADSITKTSFDEYIIEIDITSNYPNLYSIGYSQFVEANDLPKFVTKIQNEGINNFSVFPLHEDELYAPFTYAFSPYNREQAKQFIGYDLMDREGLSPILYEVQSKNTIKTLDPTDIEITGEVDQKGIAFLVPVESKTKKSTSGFYIVTIQLGRLSDTVKRNTLADVDINIYEGRSISRDKILYGDFPQNNTKFSKTSEVQIRDRTYTVQAIAKAPNSKTTDTEPLIFLLLGAILSILLATFIFFLIRNKELEVNLKQSIAVQKAKENLLSLASHQLRTPATGVKQYVSMVLDGYAGSLNTEQRAMLEKANDSNERQLRIVNQILRISILENDSLGLQLEAVDPMALITDIVNEQNEILGKRHVEIVPANRNILVPMDLTYFRMVLENLINNASKYSKDGSTITVTFEIENDYFVFRICDDGVGIAEENFEKIFEAFTRIDNEFTFKVDGTGIGLYVDSLIVNLHNGTIDIESELGVGTTFIVKIPLLKEQFNQKEEK